MSAHIAGVSYALPGDCVTNADLARENPDWDVARIGKKVGISRRHIAGRDECASDLAFRAAEALFCATGFDRRAINALLFCSQSPDYVLPATACVLQDRLGLGTDCGALDFNQGCSGYVYGLYLARALVLSGSAENVLLLTGETYSKYIHPKDRSVRPLFGDAGTATLVTARDFGPVIGECVLGTDGSGAGNLIVPAGGSRLPRGGSTSEEMTDEGGSVRSQEHLYMNGPEIFAFTLERVPAVIQALLAAAGIPLEGVDRFVFHQANAFMNGHLVNKLGVPREKAPMYLDEVGNTVSGTIPIVLAECGASFAPKDKVVLAGFGVGYSWGAALLEWRAGVSLCRAPDPSM